MLSTPGQPAAPAPEPLHDDSGRQQSIPFMATPLKYESAEQRSPESAQMQPADSAAAHMAEPEAATPTVDDSAHLSDSAHVLESIAAGALSAIKGLAPQMAAAAANKSVWRSAAELDESAPSGASADYLSSEPTDIESIAAGALSAIKGLAPQAEADAANESAEHSAADLHESAPPGTAAGYLSPGPVDLAPSPVGQVSLLHNFAALSCM